MLTLSTDIQGLIAPEFRLTQAARDLPLGKIILRACI